MCRVVLIKRCVCIAVALDVLLCKILGGCWNVCAAGSRVFWRKNAGLEYGRIDLLRVRAFCVLHLQDNVAGGRIRTIADCAHGVEGDLEHGHSVHVGGMRLLACPEEQPDDSGEDGCAFIHILQSYEILP